MELILVQGQTYCIEILRFMFRVNDILLTRCSFPATGKISSLLPHTQFVSRAQTDLYSVGTGVFPLGLQWLARQVYLSHPFGAEVKSRWIYISIPLYTFRLAKK